MKRKAFYSENRGNSILLGDVPIGVLIELPVDYFDSKKNLWRVLSKFSYEGFTFVVISNGKRTEQLISTEPVFIFPTQMSLF